MEYSRTDIPPTLPRWLALVLASVATLVAIGALWSLAPDRACGGGDIMPGPIPCGEGGTGAALTTAGFLLVLLATMFVVSFTVVRRRGLVVLILAGAMLLVTIVGAIATVAAASAGAIIVY